MDGDALEESGWTQAYSYTSPMLPRYPEGRSENTENEDSSYQTRLKSHTSSTGNVGSSTVASTVGYDQSSLHSGGEDDDEDIGGLPPSLITVSLSQQEASGLSNSAEAPNTLNASPPRPATRGSSAAIMSFPTETMLDPEEMILDFTEGTDSDDNVAETSGTFNHELEVASEPEDPSPSDSGSAYEPSQTSKTNGHRIASSKQQAGQKKPATRSQTRGTQASPKEATEQLDDSPSPHSSATKSLVNQRSGNGSDPNPIPRRNLAQKLYESRAAQKATRENESARPKQKSQNKPTGRGKIAKRPFTEDPDQPRAEEVTKKSSGAKPDKLPRGKTASQNKTSSNTQKRKNKTIQVPASDEDNDDPYAFDLELQPETPMVKQSKKVSGKSQRRKSAATQQKSATRPPGRRQASVLSEPQENSVLEIDDIEDSAMEEVDSRSSISTRKPKLVDTMKKDGELAAPSKKERSLKAKSIVDAPKMGNSNHEATNQNKTAVQDLTQSRKPAKSRTKASESHDVPSKTLASPSIVHFDPVSRYKPQESETPNAASEMNETDGESAFDGPAIEEEVHSEHDVPASADERSITPMVESTSDSSEPVKKELPFRKRGGRRRTETNADQEYAIPRKDDEQSTDVKRKRATAEDRNVDDRESKRARQSTHAETATQPAEKRDTIDQPVSQTQTNDQTKEPKMSSTDFTVHQNLEPPTIILSDESISSSEDMPTPIVKKVIDETVVKNKVIKKHENPFPEVTVVAKQSERRHVDTNEPNALISSVGSSTSAATLVRSDAPADPKILDPGKSSTTSKSYHSAQTSPHPVEIIESPRLPPPVLNHTSKAEPVVLSHELERETVFKQPILPQNKIRASTSHQNVSRQQQTDFHTRGHMDHSQTQSDFVVPGLEISDNIKHTRTQGLHHDHVFPERRVDPRESPPKYAVQREGQPKARDVERPAVRVQAKARVLDHDDVFSPGIGNYKQNESSFVDELRRKAKARDEAEAALQLQAKARNFTEELLRKPNRTHIDENHGRFDVESNDRAQHQSSEVQQTLHPHAVEFGRELLKNDQQRTIEYQSSDLGAKFDGTRGFVPAITREGAHDHDPKNSLSRRNHHGRDSLHRTEHRNRAVASETQTAEEKSILSWQAEVDRAANGLADTMHDITMVSMVRCTNNDLSDTLYRHFFVKFCQGMTRSMILSRNTNAMVVRSRLDCTRDSRRICERCPRCSKRTAERSLLRTRLLWKRQEHFRRAFLRNEKL